MTTARDVMHPGCECLKLDDDLTTASKRMAEYNVGALPVCGDDGRLRGIITDRDIVVKVLAKDVNPADVTAEDLIQGTPAWSIEADADVEEVLDQMVEHKIRRLPVVEERTLVGIVSQADLAANLPEERVGRFVEAISSTSH